MHYICSFVSVAFPLVSLSFLALINKLNEDQYRFSLVASQLQRKEKEERGEEKRRDEKRKRSSILQTEIIFKDNNYIYIIKIQFQPPVILFPPKISAILAESS